MLLGAKHLSEIRPTGGLGDTMPMKKCWVCGAEATMFPGVPPLGKKEWDENVPQRGYCNECFKEHEKALREARADYVRLKKQLMFERAVRILERQQLDIYEYEEAIKAVEEFSKENLDKFASAHEMVAAIILVDNEINVVLQKKVLQYTVDFFLPELKIILEIDGERHSYKLHYDNERDIELRRELGGDWEVVRIKTEYLEQKAELLVEAIKAVKQEKQILREQFNGLLPDWYSRREFAKKDRRAKRGDEFLLGE